VVLVPTIRNDLSLTTNIDKEFVGTVAFKNEKLSLPDGSKVAIGMDGEYWVIVYQESASTPFIICEYNADKDSLIVDKKVGSSRDKVKVKKIVDYFFEHAEVDDLVTIESGGKQS
jgi:hypothetical protein